MRPLGSAILACLALAACGDARMMRVGLGPLSDEGIPGFQQVNDSVQLVATEWKHQLFGAAEPTPNSIEAPDRYQWSSSNVNVAEVRPPGWMVTHSAGTV